MSEAFLKIVNMSISASWLVLAVLVFRLLLKKAPKWAYVLLWGIVAVRLICPFSIESAFSLIPSTETISPEIMMDWTPEISTGIEPLDEVVNPVISTSFAPEPSASANPLQILIPVMANIWLLGILAMLIYTAVSYLRLRHKVSTAVRLRDNIFQSEYAGSPFVLGILKPRIYLPYSIDRQNMEHVVAHERSHIRRKDHWWKPLGFLLLTIHWFNPIMWVAYILLCRDIELACDEKVIAQLENDQRADYTQALVECSVNRRSIAACPLAFGEVGVKDRVKSIMNYRKPTFWIIVAAVVVCVTAAVCFLTDPNPSSEFSMNGNNVSDLAPEAIVERILDIEDWESSNVYMNSNNFSLTVNSDFNWMDSQAIQYFFSNNQGTYSAQLRIFPEEGKFFLTESSEWEDQERIFLLRHYLEAIKYLPQEALQQMAPADQYLIRHIDGGTPKSNSRVITYTPSGAKEIDSWFIHLEVQPLHAANGAYNGTEDDVIHVFYGDDDINSEMSRVDLFADQKDDSIRTVSSIQNMEPITTRNGDILILQNEGGMWHFEAGQEITISVLFKNDGSSLSMKSVGYIYCGDGSEAISAKEIFSDQNVSQSSGSITIPETGNYLFYFRNYSASWIELNSFTVAYGFRLLAHVLEIHDGYFLVEPIEGSWELGSADRIEVPMKNMSPSLEPQVGDLLQIEYNGQLLETYPARISEVYGINVVYVVREESQFSEFDKVVHYTQQQLNEIFTGLTKDGVHDSWGFPDSLMQDYNGEIYHIPGTYQTVMLYFDSDDIVKAVEIADRNVSLPGSTYEIYNVAPLEDLPDTYNVEEATIDQCVIISDGDVRENQDVWEAFINRVNGGEPAAVRIGTRFRGSETEPSSFFVQELTFDGSTYQLRWFEDGEEYVQNYQYLRCFSGEAETEFASYDAYVAYILTDHPTATRQELFLSYASSAYGAAIAHYEIYTDLIYYPDFPDIPSEFVKAELWDGDVRIATYTDETMLGKLQVLLSNAEAVGYVPKTYWIGCHLILTGADGSMVTLELDTLSDYFVLNGAFYDYGPGYDEDGSLDATMDLLALLGISEWPMEDES